MKHFRHLFTALLLLCVTVVSAHDFVVGGIYYNITGTTSVEVTYQGSHVSEYREYSGTVKIPESVIYNGTTYSVTKIGDHTFNYTNIENVVIPNSITTIGDYAFKDCDFLSIIIPSSVTYIRPDAFYGCKINLVVNFSDLKFEKGSTDYGRIALLASHLYNASDCVVVGDYVFNQSNGVNTLVAYCGDPELKELTLPANYNGEKYKIGDYAFYACGNLRSFTVGSGVSSFANNVFPDNKQPTKVIFLGNTPPTNLTKVKGTVNYVSSAENYDFPTIEYANLSSMFEVDGVKYVLVSAKDRTCDVIDCNYNNPIENLLIDNQVTYRNIKLNVRNIGDYALYDNDNMQNITINNNGTIGNYAFAECASLEEIVIPDNIQAIGSSCFEKCIALEKAFVGGGVKIFNKRTFYGCSALEEVKVGENVATIDTYVFAGCSSLPQINIPQATTKINNDVFNSCTNLKTVIIEDKTGSLTLGRKTSSPYQLFADCKLDSVYIGGKLEYNTTSSYGYSPFHANKYLRSVTYSDAEVEIYNYEFKKCSNLQHVVIGKGISTIGNRAFEYCTSLESITIPDWVTAMGGSCFAGCTALKSAKVGSGVKKFDYYAFGGCSALTDMQIGCNVETINNSVFRGCTSLPSINIPQATTVISDSVFYNCKSLADVIIEDRTTELNLGSNGYSPLYSSCPLDSVYIGGVISYKTSPFSHNTSLRTVVVADNETLVHDKEFYGCTGLTDVVIGDGVTNIGDWAFSGCTGLLSFSFGSKVETIGAEAFSDCTNMVKIVSSCDVPPVCGDQALADINVWDCTLYVPNDYIDAYYAAEQWWDFFFIDGAEYTITFMIGDEKYSEVTVKYGAEITLPMPTKEGYTFQGWADVPAVMPADNIVVYGSFKANDYTITYIVDGGVYETVTVACDAVVVPIEAPEKDGYTFNHWEVLPQIMPAHDVEVVAVYDEIPAEVTITVGQYGSTVYSSKYALDFSDVDGLKAYAATGYNTNSGVITMTKVATAVEGMGLYLIAAPGEYKVPVIGYSNDNSLNMLVGNLEKSIVNAVSDDGLYANYKYTIKSGDAAPKFYQYSDGSSISAGKAYLQIPLDWVGANASKAIGIRFDEGKTTDIDNIEAAEGEMKTVFDLQGRKVEEASKGIYIVNGKKVYKKY